MIMLDCHAGLCNRLNAIASAYRLANELQTTLHVEWSLSKIMPCGYQVLFSLPDSIHAKKYPDVLYRRRIKNSFRRHFFRRSFFDNQRIVGIREDRQQYIEVCRGAKRLFFAISTIVPSATGVTSALDGRDYRIFTPSRKVLERMRAALRQVGPGVPLVGVHIRRGDHIRSTRFSRTDLFVDHMNQEVRKDPETIFYVATDSTQELQAARETFGRRIVSLPDVDIRRSSEQGQIDAFAELLCLSSCGKIIGSVGSTYTTLAGSLGANGSGIPVVRVGEEEFQEARNQGVKAYRGRWYDQMGTRLKCE